MNKHLEKVDNNYIRYANCWEDADLLLKGLAIESGDKVLSIGSAGDNSFSMLTGSPDLVVAVDINFAQLQLIALKKAAFQTLSYEEFVSFLGFEISNERLNLFEKVKTALSEESLDYWSARIELIEKGIIYQGKFEKYFKLFRTKILPLVHSPKTINTLFCSKKELEQQHFFKNKWNNRRWRSFFKLFFSKRLMGWFGRDPQFLSAAGMVCSYPTEYNLHFSLFLFHPP